VDAFVRAGAVGVGDNRSKEHTGDVARSTLAVPECLIGWVGFIEIANPAGGDAVCVLAWFHGVTVMSKGPLVQEPGVAPTGTQVVQCSDKGLQLLLTSGMVQLWKSALSQDVPS
jgi:hypothetical protein